LIVTEHILNCEVIDVLLMSSKYTHMLPIDVFQPAFTDLCVVHQNVQGLFSKMAEIDE